MTEVRANRAEVRFVHDDEIKIRDEMRVAAVCAAIRHVLSRFPATTTDQLIDDIKRFCDISTRGVADCIAQMALKGEVSQELIPGDPVQIWSLAGKETP